MNTRKIVCCLNFFCINYYIEIYAKAGAEALRHASCHNRATVNHWTFLDVTHTKIII